MMVIVSVIFAWIVLGLATALTVGRFLRGSNQTEPEVGPEPEISGEVLEAIALCHMKPRRTIKSRVSAAPRPRTLAASSSR
jgi:hypothetical protein